MRPNALLLSLFGMNGRCISGFCFWVCLETSFQVYQKIIKA